MLFDAPLTLDHRKPRMNWARDSLRANDRAWLRTIWSDEKKFKLDGTARFAKYWEDRDLPRS